MHENYNKSMLELESVTNTRTNLKLVQYDKLLRNVCQIHFCDII